MVSVGKGYRLSPNEEAALIQKEKDRRRKQRLQQVREQEKQFARRLRNVVTKKKQEELQVLANQLKENWLREQRNKVEALQKLYRQNLQSIGEGHKEASEQKPLHIEKTISSIRNNRKAQERYNIALENLQTEQDAQWQKENAHILARQTALEAERIRAAKIAKLPPPEGRWNLDDDGPELHTVKLTSEAGLSTTHYHVTAGYAEKASSHEQQDARKAAIEESQRLKEDDYDRLKEIKERHEKAVLRHKYAREKELLKQDYNHLMNELGQLEQMDRKRRQAVVASIPKQVFQPPHKRLEDRLEHQQNLEEVFEDMYMAKTDFAGDLTLALDPQPPASDHDLDLTSESTIETDILQPFLSRLPTPSKKHPPDKDVSSPDETHSDVGIPSKMTADVQSDGLETKSPAQFPIGVDKDDSSALTQQNDIVEEAHPPAKTILPRSEALGRLLRRIRGQQTEVSSQHEASSSTMTTSSSSRPSDLSQYPIGEARPVLPASISEHNDLDRQQNLEDNQLPQAKEDDTQSEKEKEEQSQDEQVEPILAGSPTLLHPLEKAALIRTKVDLQKQTEEQAQLIARTKQQIMQLREHQEHPTISPLTETCDEDSIPSSLPNLGEDRQQVFHQQDMQDSKNITPKIVDQSERFQNANISNQEPSINHKVTQPQQSMTTDRTLSDFSRPNELDDPVLHRIRLYQQHLLQQHTKMKHDISQTQKTLEQTTEYLLNQQKQRMSTVPPSQLQVHSTDKQSITSPSRTGAHPGYAYLQPQENMAQTTSITMETTSTKPNETSQLTDYSPSFPEQHLLSFQPRIHQSQLETSVSIREEPTTDNTISSLFMQPQTENHLDKFYREHKIRTQWLEEQQELLRQQREALLKHQEMHKRSLEEKQIQLKAQLKGDFHRTSSSNESVFDSNDQTTRDILPPTVDASAIADEEIYPDSTQLKEMLGLGSEAKEQNNVVTPDFDINQHLFNQRTVHFQEPASYQSNQRQKTYPPVSIPKVIPMDFKLNTHELSTIPEMDASRSQSQSMFQNSSLQFKSLMAEEASDTTSDSQMDDETEVSTNDYKSHRITHFQQGPLKIRSPRNEAVVKHSPKISPQAVIKISNPVIEQDFKIDQCTSFSLHERSGYQSSVGTGQETLPHFKPHEFQSSTQNSENLEESIPAPLNSVSKNSSKGVVWKDLLSHPLPNLADFKSSSLQDRTVHKNSCSVNTLDSTETKKHLQNISRDLRLQLGSQQEDSNHTALSEYRIDKGIQRAKFKQRTSLDNPDDQLLGTKDATVHTSQNLNKYINSYSPIKPMNEGNIQRPQPDQTLQESLYSLHTPARLPPKKDRLYTLYPSHVPESSDLQTYASDVSSEFNTSQKKHATPTFYKLQADITGNSSFGSYVTKDHDIPSQNVPKKHLGAALRNYSLKQAYATKDESEYKESGTESELSQYSLPSDPSTSSKDGIFQLSSEVSQCPISKPGEHSFDTKTQNVKSHNIDDVSRTSEESTMSSVNTDKNERSQPEYSDDDFVHRFPRLSINVGQGQYNKMNTSSKSDVTNQFLQLHETQNTTGSISIGQDSNDVSIISHRNDSDMSTNKDDLKRMLQTLISRRALTNQGFQMFSDVSFSQYSLSSDGPSYLSKDLSQMISGRTISGLGQVSEEERIDLPSGSIPMFVRRQPPSKSQSSMSEDPDQTEPMGIYRFIPQKMSPIVGRSKITGSSTEGSEQEQDSEPVKSTEIHRYIHQNMAPVVQQTIDGGSSTESSEPEQVDRLTELVNESKQVRQKHHQQKEIDLKKLEQINEAYKKTEKELNDLLSQTKDDSVGIMEEPDLTLVSIPDTTISGGSLFEATLSEGPVSNVMSDSEMVSKLSEGNLPVIQMMSVDQGTALSEGLLIQNDSHLEYLSEGRLSGCSASLSEGSLPKNNPLSEGQLTHYLASGLSEGLLSKDNSHHLEPLSEGRLTHYSASGLSEHLLTKDNIHASVAQSEGRLEEDFARCALSEGSISKDNSQSFASLSERKVTDHNTSSDNNIWSKDDSKQLEPLSEGNIDYSGVMSEGLQSEDDFQPLVPVSASKITEYSNTSVDDISESLLSFQKHEDEVATPMSQTSGNAPQDHVAASSSFQILDTSSVGLSLQEAFAKHKKGFIMASKRRQDELSDQANHTPTVTGKSFKPKKKMMAKNSMPKLETASSSNENSSNSASKVTPKTMQAKTKKSNKKATRSKSRKDLEKENHQRNLRLYNQLEEVKTKKKDEERKKFYEENRRKMKAFHNKVQSHLKQRASQSKK